MATFVITVPQGLLVSGESKPFREYFRKLGGNWCTVLNGWWFDELVRASVLDLQARAERGELPVLAETPVSPPEAVVAAKLAPRVKEPVDWRQNVKADGTRAGKKWPVEEEEALLKAIQEGQELKALAVEHKRSLGSLTVRLGDIAMRLEAEGKSEYEIICLTGLSASQIQEFKRAGGGRWSGKPGKVTVAQVQVGEDAL